MTKAEKITVAVHAAEALGFLVIMTIGMVYMMRKFNTLSTDVNTSQKTATTATVTNMNKIATSVTGVINKDGKKVGSFLDAGTTTIKSLGKTSDALRKQIKPTAQSLQNAANSATGLTNQATATLKTTQTTILGLQPLETASTGEVNALHATTDTANGLLANVNKQVTADSKPINSLLVHSAASMAHFDRISYDGQRVSDKLAADFLRRTPWWKWPIKEFGNTMDIGAAIARHTP